MNIDLRSLDGAHVAVIDGRLDLRSAPELKDQGTAALAASGGTIVLDMADVEVTRRWLQGRPPGRRRA